MFKPHVAPLFWLLIAVLLSGSTAVSGQSAIKAYVTTHTLPVVSVDPQQTQWDDLKAIGDAIGESRIVMLGEQDHGDATAFLAKSRLIRYLHETKGFTVLAFESDFFGLNLGWDQLAKQPDSIRSFIKKNIFPIWTFCDGCQFLFEEYIPARIQTDKPLQISGFDNQMILGYSVQQLRFQIDSLAIRLQLPITNEESYRSRFLPMIDSLWKSYGSASQAIEWHAELDRYLQRLKKETALQLDSSDVWRQLINNLIAENETFDLFKQNKRREGFNRRDYQMARNLEWLARVKYPKEKIIVWAANGHIVPWGTVNADGLRTMGSVFMDDPRNRDSTFVIGFTSYKGKMGRLGQSVESIPKPRKNSFETWIPDSLLYSFTPMRPFRKQYPNFKEFFFLKGLGHMGFNQNWSSVYDGIFFIRYMEACKR